MSINPTLKILSLEDSLADFEIIHYQLANAGYDLDMLRVETERDFEAAIRNNKFDVILSDFNLPGFDGFGALHLCNEICPDVPFICVSGSIGEETAIELLKLGAIDYVLKDKPDRLPFSIQRALDEAHKKETLRKAETQVRKLSRAVEQSPNIIFITDTDGIIEYANNTTFKTTGYNSEELIGQTPRIFMSGETSRDEYTRLWETIKSGKEWVGEFHNKKKNGELFWESANIAPIIDEHGVITNFLAIKKDITEYKKLIIELIQAKEHAEESDRLKSAFLANMSHEIRTPMNGILGFAELLKEPGLTVDKQEEYLRIIEKSGARMLNIINDIVDISKIESGQMKLSISETDVNDQMEFIYNFFKSEVQQKGLQLRLKNQLPLSKTIITTDREKLYAILTNLVKNAIKYTREGFIEFGYDVVETLHATSLQQTTLQFYVKDTGIGIPKNRQKAIFERFIQADIIDIMARQGAGLGLSISKAYTEMLGGKIWVESEEGKGSTFFFTLPNLTGNKEKFGNSNNALVQVEETQVKLLKILIAEDDEASEKLLSISVKKFADEIIIATTGTEAVEACRKYPDIDLILMDIQMSDMDGYEATRQIRKFNPEVIIIAQTAYAMSGDQEKAMEVGCNDYVSKPISRTKIKELIQKYFRMVSF